MICSTQIWYDFSSDINYILEDKNKKLLCLVLLLESFELDIHICKYLKDIYNQYVILNEDMMCTDNIGYLIASNYRGNNNFKYLKFTDNMLLINSVSLNIYRKDPEKRKRDLIKDFFSSDVNLHKNILSAKLRYTLQ